MRLVVETEPGVVELNWTWLPTWLGHNRAFKEEMEAHINKWAAANGIIGSMCTAETLDRIHLEVRRVINERFSEPRGLAEYLDGLRFVDDCGQEEG